MSQSAVIIRACETAHTISSIKEMCEDSFSYDEKSGESEADSENVLALFHDDVVDEASISRLSPFLYCIASWIGKCG